MKKFLLLLLGLLALLILTILGVGLASESVEYENSVTIDRPPAAVWAVFSDADRMKDWMIGLERFENISGEHLEVGSRWRFVFLEDGKEIEVTETVTAVEENRRFAFDLDAEPFQGHTEVTLVPEGTGTRLTAANTVRGKGLLWRAVMRLSTAIFESRGQEHYSKLKTLIESGA